MIKIDERYCKGCMICVEFCPGNVLKKSEKYPIISNLEKCTKCYNCVLYCPDFAIEVS